MTQEEILEGEKLIGEFDGITKDRYGRYYKKGVFKGNSEHDFIYHSDWNWLMSAVDKISKLHSIPELYANYSKGIDALMMLDINILFKAVVEFIKWYNKNK